MQLHINMSIELHDKISKLHGNSKTEAARTERIMPRHAHNLTIFGNI